MGSLENLQHKSNGYVICNTESKSKNENWNTIFTLKSLPIFIQDINPLLETLKQIIQ